jgi:hypothetical protein
MLPGHGCWDGGEYPSDCHIGGVLSFWVYQDFVPAAVNVGVSPGFAVFVLQDHLKGKMRK